MEVLFEYRGSRRPLSVASGESVTRVVSAELQKIGKPRARVFTAGDDLPSVRRAGEPSPDIYLLQKWSVQWDCYVDVHHHSEVHDGDKLAVIAKPKPPSKFFLLCCCGADSSYEAGKVGGSGKAKVPKTEEIQSLEYRFRIESEAGSEWEAEDSQSTTSQANAATKEGECYIRAASGRASWKLVKNQQHDTATADNEEMIEGLVEEGNLQENLEEARNSQEEGNGEEQEENQTFATAEERVEPNQDAEESSDRVEQPAQAIGDGPPNENKQLTENKEPNSEKFPDREPEEEVLQEPSSMQEPKEETPEFKKEEPDIETEEPDREPEEPNKEMKEEAEAEIEPEKEEDTTLKSSNVRDEECAGVEEEQGADAVVTEDREDGKVEDMTTEDMEEGQEDKELLGEDVEESDRAASESQEERGDSEEGAALTESAILDPKSQMEDEESPAGSSKGSED